MTKILVFCFFIVVMSGAWVMSQSSLSKIESTGPLKVFILAGQSNMEGQGVVDMDHPEHYNSGKGNLVWSMEHSSSANMMRHLKNEKGEWVVRDDVFISFKSRRKKRSGGLTIGYTTYGGSSHIGPELQFGHVMGDYFSESVVLIKTAWGGKSLYKDFRPPSAEGETGFYYEKMLSEIREALSELGEKQYEIVGFVWQQGFNDMIDLNAVNEYADNLVLLAKDVRNDLVKPNLPFIVGELGNGGRAFSPTSNMQKFRDAQRAGANQIENAIFVETVDFARPAELSPNKTHMHHWCGNSESYFLIGHALAEGMKKLLKK